MTSSDLRTPVGRSVEVAAVAAAIRDGRHLVIQGPPGVGKSFLVEAACARVGATAERVEGGVLTTVAQLVGHHDPALVVRRGFDRDAFTPGPALRAVVEGRPLHIADAEAMPPGLLASLVTVMSEGVLTVPRVGTFRAAEGFVVAATLATPRGSAVPMAFLERTLQVTLDYQPGAAEREIVRSHYPHADPWLTARAVDLVRATRHHAEIQQGASLRGALDLVAVATVLVDGFPTTSSSRSEAEARTRLGEAGLRSALLALSSRITLQPWVRRDVDSVIRDLWADVEITASRATGRSAGGRVSVKSTLDAVDLGSDGEPEIEADPETDLAPLDHAAVSREPEPEDLRPGRAGRRVPSAPGEGATSIATAEVERESVLAVRDVALRGERGLRRVTFGETLDDVDIEQLQRLAARVVVGRARERIGRVHGRGGRLATVRYNFGSDDLDIDRTIESLIEHPLPEHDDLWVHERVPRQRAVVLMLDVSGSMRGSRLVELASAAATLALTLPQDEVAVVAFGETAEILRAGGRPGPALELVTQVLSLRPAGLTDIAAGLRAGRDLAASMRGQRPQAIAMTDGVANAGSDPLPVAHGFDRLNVLATTRSPWRLGLCQALAAAGSGTVESYEDLAGLPDALSRLLL